ncbi:hypothetical protein V8G54_004852, partial [Vigna mungo]
VLHIHFPSLIFPFGDFFHIFVRDEAHVIENVVNDVLQKLHLRCPTELKGLVASEENCRNVELLLKSCRVIGIWGMGGTGKSTIAKILFAKHFPQYDHVCFVTNAKEYSLDKLFSTILKEEVSEKNVVGSSFHMRRLRSKKVFIVLDDVDMDSFEPLEYLCREYKAQHRDSKLVITTRDRQLLVERVDAIYEVQKWKKTESLKLFCSEAFKKSYPDGGFDRLSESVVEYAGGVPLALKVLGSYLRSKSSSFWKSTIRKLSLYPNERIQEVLEMSYTGLHDLEKKIFLDIVFFFREKQKDQVTRILDACGFEATSGIEVLADKALLTISYTNIIQMHDLLQQMGLEIVRLECTTDPGRRSRLKDNDAHEVIEENKGTDAIQGIELDLSQVENLRLRSDTLTKMKTLRFLRFYNSSGQSSRNTYIDLPATLEPFSDKLRYIEWIEYPFECLPSPFCAKFLVEIHMEHGKIKQLWQGIQELDNLEGINLSGCKQFEELPDLSKAPKLKWVNLYCCESLRYLHPSVLSSATLVTLILHGCTKLESVKGEKRLKSLGYINVNGCLSLEEFAVSIVSIEIFDLSNKEIPMSGTPVRRKGKLKTNKILKELMLSNGRRLGKDLNNCNLPSMQHLYMLQLDRCNVTNLPEIIKNSGKLTFLSLENCDGFTHLPKLSSSINYLGVINCTSLVSVSDLDNLANVMCGSSRFITFKNCLKLDEHSCKLIMKSVKLIMVCAAFDNLVRKSSDVHDYSYNSVELCLPGSKVPQEIKYRSTESSITIDLPKLSNLRGFIYSVVLSPSGEMKKHDTKIICKRHLRENTRESWVYSDIEGLKTDHVYIWYDPFHCDGILKYNEPSVWFEFCVTNDKGEVDGSMCIKECGVGLISVSELPSVLEELDWHWDKKKDLVNRVELITGQRITLITSIEQSDERKNHFSAVEEIINSTHKEVKTDSDTDCGQNTTKSTNAVKYEESGETAIKQDATLPETVESELDKENESKEKSIMVELESVEDNRGSKQYFSGVKESIEYCASRATNATAERGPKEKSTKSTETWLEESIKQVVGIHDTGNSVKYSSLDLENCLQQSDENPFKIFDLLSDELSPSLKQSSDATTLLNEFRTLVFSTSLLKKIPDQSYQQQVTESLQKLHTYRGKITKEQEAGLDKFIELYNKAVDISQDKMLTEDNQAKLASEKRDLYNKLEHSKLKVQRFDTTISTYKSQREILQKRQREIQEAITELEQENEALEKDSSTLEVLYSEQQTKKKETLESVKCISISVVQTTKQLEELEKKRLSLASAYEDLKEPYQRMKTKPPFYVLHIHFPSLIFPFGDFFHIFVRDQAHVIENVVNDVLQKLYLRWPTELNGLVGYEENCRNVELLLKSRKVIGIWGMGGIGKSTIAKILFAKHFPQYDHVCFVTSAKEYSLEKLSSTILKEEVSEKNVVGSSFHMRRLRSKKVFIVLDDVDMDSFEPLEHLYREYEGQHSDSKLVITTRDRQLLVGRVDAIYEVQKWKKTESLKLFCSESFKKSYPEGGYESLSESAVEYAGGVPLALKVLGSFLRSKQIRFWESTIRKLSLYPNERIQKVLEMSYTGLHDLEKNIFLDIVFFFREKEKDHVTMILDACGFEATSGIEVLADKALLTISHTNIIQMHDLLQQMGWEIVRQECTADPGRRSRLKDKEAREVIEENKGTDAIQGIELDLSQVKNLRLRSDTLTKMKTLRFLRFYNSSGQSSTNTYLDLPATLEPFSDKLRYIEWIGYPFECLPSPFCAKFLVEIHMQHGKVKQLWHGIQELDNLEGIDLSGCKQFEELPDLSKAPKLKWVNLSCCESLRYLHPSVLSSTLVTLILNGCTKLESVKGEKHLKSLEKISVNGCLRLEEFAVSLDLNKILYASSRGIQMSGTPVRPTGKLELTPTLSNLYMLKLDQCNVTTLPEIIKNSGNLRILSVENCLEFIHLPKLPSNIDYLGVINCTSLVSVSDLVNLANVMRGSTRFITFKNCSKLDEHSCKLIMKSVKLIMVCAAFDNLVRKSRDVHDYTYNTVELCLPGNKVPQEIKYRSTESFFTIDLPKLSNLKGFIYSVVLSPSGEMKKHDTKIICKRHLRENTRESWVYSDIECLNTDHVYMWYDPFHCHGILKYNEPSVCFEFCVINDKGEVDGSMCIKECGVDLISVSELPSVLEELDWHWDKKKDLVNRVESVTGQRITLTSIEQSDEWKDHFSALEEIISSTHKEVKTDSGTDCGQNTTESTNAVSQEFLYVHKISQTLPSIY